MTYTADKRICVDAAGKVVDCESEQAARLLVGQGGTLTDAQAERYGLNKPEAKAQAPAANKARAAAENK